MKLKRMDFDDFIHLLFLMLFYWSKFGFFIYKS